MRYAVSCDMTFSDRADRDAVAVQLAGYQADAFWVPGDSLTKDNPGPGMYRVSCSYRIAQESMRDEIYDMLVSKRDMAFNGYVEKHLCGHDEGMACTGSESISWGDTNV